VNRNRRIEVARLLRENQTKSESLLWNALRGKRLCGFKFRRQHPIGPFFADFASIQPRLIVELDGGYHDYQYADDKYREDYLADRGWKVLRFCNEDVLDDVEAIVFAIGKQLTKKVVFKKRNRGLSGMKVRRKRKNAPERDGDG
jgi:very-short-patch-repair endonuclease